MKTDFLLLILLLLVSACDSTMTIEEEALNFAILPHPKSVTDHGKTVVLSSESGLYSDNKELYLLFGLFRSEVKKLTGLELEIAAQAKEQADLIFSIDSTMSREAYSIDVGHPTQVMGGSYEALLMAKTTLLQLFVKDGEQLKLPMVSITDHPDVAYRGLLVDLARQWHSLETIEKLVDLAAFYKINYLQLHFTDYQSYTLPSTAFPNLPTPDRHYSVEELKDLNYYAELRGVTIIPEIDVPGHSSPFVKKYPEIFAIQDTASNPWIINMGNEAVYEALDKIVGEALDIFKDTPYFHIGGDEAIFNKVMDDPKVQAYILEQGLEEDVHELYRHFIVRMNEIVKKHGKQMCVWEGFGPEGKIEIPKDILVFEFETNRYLPNQLVEDGYTVVNTSWKPLYVVNQKKWEPKTIYEWNMWRWENWWDQAPSFEPIQVDRSELVIGAQMCAWEQKEQVEIPSLRQRLPAFVERIWNTEEEISFEEWKKRIQVQDVNLSKLINDTRQDSLLVGHNFRKEMLQ
ncbi:MAG: family 20 glycosylhydrolase [Saprospiraceae bacterium]|nr:family 20 glycosylhydrolase [Saprospiraceae bacterium]